MNRFALILVAGMVGLALAGASAFGKGSSGARPGNVRPRLKTAPVARTKKKPATKTTRKKPATKTLKGGKKKRPNRVVARRKGKQLSQRAHNRLKKLRYSRKLTGPQRAAVAKLDAGAPLSHGERRSLLGLLSNDRAGLTAEDREAISEGLDVDRERRSVVRVSRFLKVYNDTSELLKVWVQYRTRLRDKWKWLPGEPGQSAQALPLKLPSGAAMFVEDSRGRVAASRVRLWAESSSGMKYYRHRDRDLWLVPEHHGGHHRYRAAKVETFKHRIAYPQAVRAQ